MSKSLLVVVAAATLVALPASSEARDGCLRFDHVGVRAAAVVDRSGHMLRRMGDGVVRVGDRMLGLVFCKRNRV